MKYPADWLLPALVMALALCGCSAFERRPVLLFADSAVKTASTAATGTSVEFSGDIRPPDNWLNLNLHLYGLSYHPDRQGVHRNRLDNEINLGLGLNYEFHEDRRGVAFVETGFYRDSGSNIAKLAGMGYQFKFGRYWRFGGALVGVDSQTYNHGRFFIAPLPIVTLDLGNVKLNAIYVPRYSDYNQFAVYGLYLSIPFRR